MSESMTVTILGSGTIVPSLARSTCSFLLEAAGMKLLFDIGPGTMRRLLEAGTTINEIDLLLLSHLHPDHSGELASFLFAAKYPETYRRRRPFTLAGARGLRKFFEGLTAVYGNWIVLPEDLFSLRELDNRKPDALRVVKWPFGRGLWFTPKAASGTVSRCPEASRWPIRETRISATAW